jgi:hypothetical protein
VGLPFSGFHPLPLAGVLQRTPVLVPRDTADAMEKVTPDSLRQAGARAEKLDQIIRDGYVVMSALKQLGLGESSRHNSVFVGDSLIPAPRSALS